MSDHSDVCQRQRLESDSDSDERNDETESYTGRDSEAECAAGEDAEEEDQDDVQPHVKKARSSNNRKQKYRDEWELKPEFSKWLSRAKDDHHGVEAYCKICRCKIQARLATIRVHAKSSKHVSWCKMHHWPPKFKS